MKSASKVNETRLVSYNLCDSSPFLLHFSLVNDTKFDPPDHWEILPSNIELGEALGEGAFGKVYIATVKGVSLSYSATLSPTPTGTPKSQQKDATNNLSMKAAVKMLCKWDSFWKMTTENYS